MAANEWKVKNRVIRLPVSTKVVNDKKFLGLLEEMEFDLIIIEMKAFFERKMALNMCQILGKKLMEFECKLPDPIAVSIFKIRGDNQRILMDYFGSRGIATKDVTYRSLTLTNPDTPQTSEKFENA